MSSESNIVLKTTAGGIATLMRSLRGEDFVALLDSIQLASEMASMPHNGVNAIKWQRRKAVVITFLNSIPGKYVGSDTLTANSSDGLPMLMTRNDLDPLLTNIKTGLSSLSRTKYAKLFEEVEARKVPMPNIECAKEGTPQVGASEEEGETHDGEDQVSALTNDPSSFDISNGSV